MSCIEVLRKLPDYLQGQLPAAEARIVHEHISQCEECRIVVHSARQTMRTYFPPDSGRRSTHRHAA